MKRHVGTGLQLAQCGPLRERGGDILEIDGRGRLAQAESLTEGDAARLHEVGDELVLDTLGYNRRPAHPCKRERRIHGGA